VVSGAARGSDIVQGRGTFAGAFIQNSGNLQSVESLSIECGANISSPDSQPYVSSSAHENFKGSNGASYVRSTAHQSILAFGPGTVTNNGKIEFATSQLKDNVALFPHDGGATGELPAPNFDVTEYWGNGLYADVARVTSQGVVVITNGSAANPAASITSTIAGSSSANAAGICVGARDGALQGTNVTLGNFGTVSGAYTGSGSATAAGVFAKTHGGGQDITNHASGNITASAPYLATAVWANSFFGNVSFTSEGSLSASASGSRVGNSAGIGAAVGLDIFTYSGNISATTSGSITASSSGTSKATTYGVNLWASAGSVTYTNSATISAKATGKSTTGHGLYMGSVGGPVYFKNTGTIKGSGSGWGAGLEQDTGETITVVNEGNIRHEDGIGLFLFDTKGGKADVTIAPSGSVYGGSEGISAYGYKGNITVHVSGTVAGAHEYNNAMALGPGNDTVELIGLPTIVGVMKGGDGNNTLVLKLKGTLEKVNGTPATKGNDIGRYNLEQSGYIQVSGHTYYWKDFRLTGTITP